MDPLLGRPTPGVTDPGLTELPLGTEGELTRGPDDWNPYDDPEVPSQDYAFFEGAFDPQPDVAVTNEPDLDLTEPPQLPRF